MAIYLLNIALIVFWRLVITKKRFAEPRKLYCGIVAFQWILVSGLRSWDVGADTYAYYISFERVKTQTLETLLGNLNDYLFHGLQVKDPGYSILMKIFQVLFKEYQYFLIAIAILLMVMLAKWIYENSASPCTSFIIFSSLFYSFYAITGHRQTIATALIVFGGYELIKNREFWKFTVLAVASYLIHKSSLVFVPMYLLARIPVTAMYRRLCLIVVVIIAALGKRVYGPIALWMGFGESQINYAEGGAELFAILLAILSIVILLFYPQIKKHRSDAPILYNATVITLMTALLTIQNQSFMRIQQYYSLFIMITIPELFNIVKREYRLLVYLAFGAVMILYLIRNNPQYSFFFMS